MATFARLQRRFHAGMAHRDAVGDPHVDQRQGSSKNLSRRFASRNTLGGRFTLPDRLAK
jgi:hypothetical protein